MVLLGVRVRFRVRVRVRVRIRVRHSVLLGSLLFCQLLGKLGVSDVEGGLFKYPDKVQRG